MNEYTIHMNTVTTYNYACVHHGYMYQTLKQVQQHRNTQVFCECECVCVCVCVCMCVCVCVPLLIRHMHVYVQAHYILYVYVHPGINDQNFDRP